MSQADTHINGPQPGDLTKVSMRVKSLHSIDQLRGMFEVLGETPKPPFIAMISTPEWEQVETDADHNLCVVGRFSFLGAKKSEDENINPSEKDAFIKVEADFIVKYELSGGDAFNKDDVRAFMAINSTMNAYPFWREFVYNAVSRAGVPSILIPPFNAVKSGLLRPKPQELTPGTPSGDNQP